MAKFSCYCYAVFLFFCISLCHSIALAQKVVEIQENLDQHIFNFSEVEILEDHKNQFTFQDISSAGFAEKFKPSLKSTPQTTAFNVTYWFKINIKHNTEAGNRYLLELFDQTIDHLTIYTPNSSGGYDARELGDRLRFKDRDLSHKNFEIYIENNDHEIHTYYFKVRSSQIADVIIVLRSVNWFISYALDEYFYFGIFYGMILVFSFYNLIMYIAIRQRQYLFYVLYNLSVGLFEMSSDGIAYQYLWPNAPNWNQIAYAVFLYATSVFALLFTRELLFVKAKAPKLNKLIIGVIAARSIFFLYCFFFNQDLFSYKFLEFVPLTVAFFTGIYIFKKGYQPARFFVLGYSFLFFGFSLKFLIMLGISWLNFGVFTYYSLSFCFVLEMIFLSFAIGDKVRILKKKKDKAQRQIIQQMSVNVKLKDKLNQELEKQVDARTKEVFNKSMIIESQNEELLKANEQLKQQAQEISRMNVLLEQDNQELQTNVEKITRDRVMSADVDFEEFSKIYPDKEHCYSFFGRTEMEKWLCLQKNVKMTISTQDIVLTVDVAASVITKNL